MNNLEQIKKNEMKNRNPLYAEIDRLRAEKKELTESRDFWKREYQLMEAAEKKAEEEIAARDRLKEEG